jgi:hypothetical protein
MIDDADISLLLDRIRETIRSVTDGSFPDVRANEQYGKLAAQYRKIEGKYVSDQSRGYVRGILYHHNRNNAAGLTAVFVMRNDEPIPVLFAGDRLLLAALPEIITREYGSLETGVTSRVRLGGSAGQDFFLALRRQNAGRETIVTAAVASSPLFTIADFEFIADLLHLICEKRADLDAPLLLDYSSDISSEISRLFLTADRESLRADLYRLSSPPGSFAGIGVHSLIDFSNYIVHTLKKHYGGDVQVFSLSLTAYLVIHRDGDNDARKSRVELSLQGNIIPYKIVQRKLDSPQAMSLLIETI